MHANDHEQSLLRAAGFTFEHPDHWCRIDTILAATSDGTAERSITIADGRSCNGFMWEVQIAIDDDTQVATEGFASVEDALAMVAREIAPDARLGEPGR